MELNDPTLYDAWAGVLSWLYDDNRFGEAWTTGRVRLFTQMAKALMGKANWTISKIYDKKYTPPGTAAVWMRKDGGKELIHHIHNGIAHGKSRTTKQSDGLWIFLRDFDEKENPIAQIRIPMEYITRLHRIYGQIERGEI